MELYFRAIRNIFNSKDILIMCHKLQQSSDQQIVIFPANRIRNRFAESTSVQIGIVIVFLIPKLANTSRNNIR